MSRVTVIGLSDRPLPEPALAALARAGLVVGGRRDLQAVAHLLPARATTHELGDDVAAALEAVVGTPDRVVVLGSGDPGFFGIVRALADRLGSWKAAPEGSPAGDAPATLEVLPAASSVALAFGRVGLPWDDAVVVSASGRDPSVAVNACRAHPKVAVLPGPRLSLGPRLSPGDLAAALAGHRRILVVAEHLGGHGERLTTGTPDHIAAGTFADPDVVLVIDPARAISPEGRMWPPAGTSGAWALPEAEFVHDEGRITKAEVRAVALAWLGPRMGDLVWDVGAGNGSVGVECARLGAAVIAIDSDAGQCRRVALNALRHDVEVEVRHGRAPQALHDLPDPDTVFVGGGGHLLPEILRTAADRASRTVVVALDTIERSGPAQRALAGAGLAVDGTALHAARLGAGGDAFLPATSPVLLLRGQRR